MKLITLGSGRVKRFSYHSSKAEGQTASSQPSQEENKRDDGKNDDEKKKKKGEEKGSKTRRNKDKAQDNSGEPTQKSNGTSKEEELARTKEEEEELARQRKEERRRKDNEFILELAKATAMSGLQALGRDRMFRRYWSFRSLRGLFVEDDDPEMAAFLGGSGDEEESEVSNTHQSSNEEIQPRTVFCGFRLIPLEECCTHFSCASGSSLVSLRNTGRPFARCRQPITEVDRTSVVRQGSYPVDAQTR